MAEGGRHWGIDHCLPLILRPFSSATSPGNGTGLMRLLEYMHVRPPSLFTPPHLSHQTPPKVIIMTSFVLFTPLPTIIIQDFFCPIYPSSHHYYPGLLLSYLSPFPPLLSRTSFVLFIPLPTITIRDFFCPIYPSSHH